MHRKMGGVGSEFVGRCSGLALACGSREGQKASVTSAGNQAQLVVGAEPGFESSTWQVLGPGFNLSESKRACEKRGRGIEQTW